MDDQSQQDQQDSGQEPAQSQEQPQDDSQLQTPQPDQPTPPEVERQSGDDSQVSQPDTVGGSTASVGPSGEPAEGDVQPVQPPEPARTSAEQEERKFQEETDLEAQRREHNERTGGGPVNEGELQAQRDEHNSRVGGGASESDSTADGEGSQDQA